jgi:PST family polysaccharide transporter
VINKLVTIGAMLLLAHLLSPDDFGRATLATSFGAFMSVISPYVLGDVLLSMSTKFRSVSGAAFWTGIWSAGLLFLVIAVAGPLVESVSGKAGVAACILMVAFRPACDAVLVVPFAKLRIDLSYRVISIIDLAVILVSTAASVTMAWFGAGAAALVIPPIATLAVRGCIYWAVAGRSIPLRPVAGEVRPLVRRFAVASVGQYLNNVLQVLEILVLGWFASEAGIGFFGFAFQLAIQANVVIATQLGVVLQPIFARMHDEPSRQVAAFVRATRLMGSVAVPLSIFQAALAIPAFGLLFGPKWDGAVAAFAVLSVGQAFMFVAAPATALVKAQGRFRAYVIWQSAQLAVAISGFCLAAAHGAGMARWLVAQAGFPSPEAAGIPVAVAIASALVWMASCPLGVWIGGRPARLSWGSVAEVFLRPWMWSLPAAVLAVCAWEGLRALLSPEMAAAIALFVVSPPLLLGAVALSACSHPDSRADLRLILARFARRR